MDLKDVPTGAVKPRDDDHFVARGNSPVRDWRVPGLDAACGTKSGVLTGPAGNRLTRAASYELAQFSSKDWVDLACSQHAERTRAFAAHRLVDASSQARV